MKYQLQIDDAFSSIMWKNSDKTPLKSGFKKRNYDLSVYRVLCFMSQVSEIMDILEGD